MSQLEETFAEIVRKVVREELERHERPLEPLLTAEGAAELLCLPVQTIYKLKREGKLKHVALGDSTLRFEQEEVRKFIADRAA